MKEATAMMEDASASHLKTLEGGGIIRCIEKGKLWAKGAMAMASTYAWLVGDLLRLGTYRQPTD
jgi:hypothetical protein